MSIWWSLHLRREAASVPLARRLLLGTMETAGVDPDISYDLSVALSEACANAVEHGGDTGHGDSRGAYRVTAYLDGEKCRIEVADSGPGFPAAGTAGSPAAEAPRRPVPVAAVPYDAESGRGLSLIEELADHVTIGNKPGRGGAVVSFDKMLKWQKDAPLMAV
ncbi:ATP-binding protein [Streptomyces sp. ME02-8801-2C]|uniref:ATP-binding protein n=1 Tax=Streptomyces sp. ME02-8801-2C TaxID=3028680 RepID=UPI0029A66120|nr:ATP-binding protein [Streptomyces sp. ME02-8801-2C]MDX3454186.1 ATP-binding protein [Streptomyces sp. ME02-8801-2C]